MNSSSDLRIDEVILSIGEAPWRKVAFVIIKVAEIMGSDLPEGDAGYELVANRIENLVRSGRLSVQGDIEKWRHSEIRKTN
jgi:hypothetical protein